MTQNQIAYWAFKENERANKARENYEGLLKAAQAEEARATKSLREAQHGHEKVATIVEGIKGFESASAGIDHLASAAQKTVSGAVSAAGAF